MIIISFDRQLFRPAAIHAYIIKRLKNIPSQSSPHTTFMCKLMHNLYELTIQLFLSLKTLSKFCLLPLISIMDTTRKGR